MVIPSLYLSADTPGAGLTPSQCLQPLCLLCTVWAALSSSARDTPLHRACAFCLSTCGKWCFGSLNCHTGTLLCRGRSGCWITLCSQQMRNCHGITCTTDVSYFSCTWLFPLQTSPTVRWLSWCCGNRWGLRCEFPAGHPSGTVPAAIPGAQGIARSSSGAGGAFRAPRGTGDSGRWLRHTPGPARPGGEAGKLTRLPLALQSKSPLEK